MDDYHYDPSVLPRMVAISQRQRAKDSIFITALIPYFRTGPILEIGAGCGQLSELLAATGLDITPSDVQPFFVDYMLQRGLAARVIDATLLPSGLDRAYDNILAQSISVLITPDLAIVRRTYEAVHSALPDDGRFIFILPSGWGERWSHAADHVRLADQAGFDLVHRFRHQVFPSSVYGRLPASLLRAADGSFGRIFGVRWVFIFRRRDSPTGQAAQPGPAA